MATTQQFTNASNGAPVSSTPSRSVSTANEMSMSIETSTELALRLADAGRFGEAEEALAGLQSSDELETFRLKSVLTGIQQRHASARMQLARLDELVHQNCWADAHAVTTEILLLAPRHPVALQTRRHAEHELLSQGIRRPPIGSTGTPDASPMTHPTPKHSTSNKKLPREKPFDVTAGPSRDHQFNDSDQIRSRLPTLWIDGVGGYLLSDLEETVLGQALTQGQADIRIQGDLSRRASVFRRSGEVHLLQPLQSTRVNDVELDRAAILNSGDIIQIGPRVKLRYRRPNRLSHTAVLSITSGHRWQQGVEGVMLLGDSCILGPLSNSHILCPLASSEVVLFRNRNAWWCRSKEPIERDGTIHTKPIPLMGGGRILCGDLSMSLEI
jgi:hypothetical protein